MKIWKKRGLRLSIRSEEFKNGKRKDSLLSLENYTDFDWTNATSLIRKKNFSSVG